AKLYNLSVTTIREKLISINQGTGGKHMYDPERARQILTKKDANKRGRKRAN
ncbi:DNA-binding protein, partial [Acinetobacter baumannii]